jgi:hypothetical protein
VPTLRPTPPQLLNFGANSNCPQPAFQLPLNFNTSILYVRSTLCVSHNILKDSHCPSGQCFVGVSVKPLKWRSKPLLSLSGRSRRHRAAAVAVGTLESPSGRSSRRRAAAVAVWTLESPSSRCCRCLDARVAVNSLVPLWEALLALEAPSKPPLLK